MKHGVVGWKPFEPGDRVKYLNHYSDKGSGKFSRRYRGPFVVDSRRGVNYKIVGGLRGPKWVHHDELRP